MEKFTMREENFHEGGAGFSSIIKKKIQLEVMSNIETWNEHKILRIKGGLSPPQYLALYAKVFLVISTIYSTAFVIQGSFLKIWDKIQALV